MKRHSRQETRDRIPGLPYRDWLQAPSARTYFWSPITRCFRPVSAPLRPRGAGGPHFPLTLPTRPPSSRIGGGPALLRSFGQVISATEKSPIAGGGSDVADRTLSNQEPQAAKSLPSSY